MSVFATQPISMPPPSYSYTRHRPPSYTPPTPSFPRPITPSKSVTPSIAIKDRTLGSWIAVMLNSMSPFPYQEQGVEQSSQRISSPLSKKTSESSTSQAPPRYSSILRTNSTEDSASPPSPLQTSLSTPKPTYQNSSVEMDSFNEDYGLDSQSQVDRDEQRRREEGEEEERGGWCCRWYWYAPTTGPSIPWEAWYMF